MIDEIDHALRRLEVDIRLARENWATNPYLAMVALMDLAEGARYLEEALVHDPEAAEAVGNRQTPSNKELDDILDQHYVDAGIDLSYFTSNENDPLAKFARALMDALREVGIDAIVVDKRK